MRRSSFLKSIVTLIVAPSLMGEIEIKSELDSDKKESPEIDYLKFYLKENSYLRIGDIIVSDLGYKAMVVSVIGFAGYAIGRPIRKGEYKYNDINKIFVSGRQFFEEA